MLCSVPTEGMKSQTTSFVCISGSDKRSIQNLQPYRYHFALRTGTTHQPQLISSHTKVNDQRQRTRQAIIVQMKCCSINKLLITITNPACTIPNPSSPFPIHTHTRTHAGTHHPSNRAQSTCDVASSGFISFTPSFSPCAVRIASVYSSMKPLLAFWLKLAFLLNVARLWLNSE